MNSNGHPRGYSMEEAEAFLRRLDEATGTDIATQTKANEEALKHVQLAAIGIKIRIVNALAEHGIVSVADALNTSVNDILRISNMGPKSLNEIKKALENIGIVFSLNATAPISAPLRTIADVRHLILPDSNAEDDSDFSDEITAELRIIQSGWSRADRRQRRGGIDEDDDDTWRPPVVDTSYLS